MNAEIITIGDEILLGQTIDSNSAYIGKALHAAGVSVNQITSISDTTEAITNAVNSALQRSDLILVTGGLGPTQDDITKQTLCKIFNSQLIRNKEVEQRIADYFQKIGREMLEVNAQQADLPANAQIIENSLGTAQGMLFNKNGKLLLSMPGVPYEMRHIIDSGLLPILKEKLGENKLYYQSVATKGLPESFLALKLEDWEKNLRGEGFSLAYLPSPGLVKLRIGTNNATPENKIKIQAYVKALQSIIPKNIFAYTDTSIDKAIVEYLIEKNISISVAESCTGGFISKSFVKHSGVSAIFYGGVVAYSNHLKEKILGVNPKNILKYGAVSKAVVEEMALSIQKITGSNFALATSGIAGPEGGSKEKPVGLVHMAIAAPNQKVYHFEKIFGGDRERIINRASQYLFSELWDILHQSA